MDITDARAVGGRRALANEIATRSTDPNFFSSLTYLPNPDVILRKLGRADDVYDGIVMDAHVIGELRSVRAGMLEYEWRLQAGGDSPADLRALELAEKVFAQRPQPGMRWSDVIWNMAQAVFRGYAVHEVVWARADRVLLPVKVLDRPQRRFVFSADNELRLRTRTNQVDGEQLGDYKWLLTRHMPSNDNPYGVALLSSAFWPFTFKHSGFRYFVKFSEKYGIPWAIGRYPEGTPKDQQDALTDALASMIEDAVAAIPDTGKVELLSTSISGELVHERLINTCNREMSKALTSQTLATEIQGDGSRAASETHRERETAVNESDRQIICDTFNELLRWITSLNVQGANPPTFEFYEEAEARSDWVEVFAKARDFVPIPVRFAHERLQIPEPEEGEPVLPAGGNALEFSHAARGRDFASPGIARRYPDQAAIEGALDALTPENLQDQAEAMVLPALRAIARGADETEVLGLLAEAYPQMDDAALEEQLTRLMFAAEVFGRLTMQDELER